MDQNIPEEFFSLQQAADYMKVKRQAVYSAIHKQRLKSRRKNNRHVITRKDIDEYRASKFDRSLRTFEGEKLFDLDRGHLSVMHVSKFFSEGLRRPYPPQHFYYLIHIGALRALKKGGSWVIAVEDAKALYEKETEFDEKQMALI